MDLKNQKVSCIIPAYNEAKTIGKVIETALSVEEIEEVIVVDDGSKDKTSAIVEKLQRKYSNLKLIKNKKNCGKGYAVALGIKTAKNDLLLFLDADLINIKNYHLSSLIAPVAKKEVDMTIASFHHPLNVKTYFLWPFSGQRCLRKKGVLPFLKEISSTNYGLEPVLNEIFSKKKVIVVPWISNKLLHKTKYHKQKDWIRGYIEEVWQITEKIIKTKGKTYQKKIKERVIKNLAKYFKLSFKKVKEYLNTEI